MLGIVKIKTVEYYQKLATSEYYCSSENSVEGEPDGKWSQNLESIGIDSNCPVDSRELEKIMSGFSIDDRKLVQNAGHKKMVVGLDLTFSAPKSVSILWANADPELRKTKIGRAHV